MTSTNANNTNEVEVADLTSVSQYTALTAGGSDDRVVLVDFYTPWCSPCRAIAPKLQILANTTPNLTVVKINASDPEFENVIESLDISSVPTFHFWLGGRLLEFDECYTIEDIKAVIDRYMPR